MQREHLGAGGQHIEIRHALAGAWQRPRRQSRVIGQHAHAEGVGETGQPRADGSIAEDAERRSLGVAGRARRLFPGTVCHRGPDRGHARIVAPGREVEQGIVDFDFHLDVRTVRQQPLKGRQKDAVCRVLARGDPHGAARLLAQVAKCGEPHLDLVECRAEGLEQALAGLGWRDAAGGAGQQPQPQPCFERTQGLAERRGGNSHHRDTSHRGHRRPGSRHHVPLGGR